MDKIWQIFQDLWKLVESKDCMESNTCRDFLCRPLSTVMLELVYKLGSLVVLEVRNCTQILKIWSIQVLVRKECYENLCICIPFYEIMSLLSSQLLFFWSLFLNLLLSTLNVNMFQAHNSCTICPWIFSNLIP